MMIKNYISVNILYLLKKSNLSQEDFGNFFELGKGLISNYIHERALPKVETIQRICLHFEISIDDFINADLSAAKPYATKHGELLYSNEKESQPYVISPKYVELLEKSIEDKDKIIKALEEKINPEKSKTA
ncbi:helix-turn-helix domain-containing protein [Flavobacterium sp. XS2P12]|uniref:helix-turn-helix domain-containing protein n=1 Tax=Flavobacterium melibiosi TaxID=3398734 RepID=UPI003A85632D